MLGGKEGQAARVGGRMEGSEEDAGTVPLAELAPIYCAAGSYHRCCDNDRLNAPLAIHDGRPSMLSSLQCDSLPSLLKRLPS